MSDSKKSSEVASTIVPKQKRAQVTRQELIRSARTIFARDGFEHARLEDIAKATGKTRGAFYANFKDKEDVFCAIFEDNIDRDLAELGPLLSSIKSKTKRIEAFCDYLNRLSQDRQRTLLNLEFKLYAIRHPRKRKRLAALHALMRLRCSLPELNELVPAVNSSNDHTRRNGATRSKSNAPHSDGSLAIGGIVDGLALNHLFDPDAMNAQELSRYLSLCVREALHS